VVTLVGFGIAIHQIRATKTASEQAKEVAEGVRNQILQMNAVRGLDAAIKAFEIIRKLHRAESWDALPELYTSLKHELIAIKVRTPNMSDAHRTQLQNAIQQISNMEKQVEGTIGGGSTPEVDRMNNVVSRQMDRLGQVIVELQIAIERPRQ
jgi:phosphoglycerate-specific signal transduction histidine kinase